LNGWPNAHFPSLSNGEGDRRILRSSAFQSGEGSDSALDQLYQRSRRVHRKAARPAATDLGDWRRSLRQVIAGRAVRPSAPVKPQYGQSWIGHAEGDRGESGGLRIAKRSLDHDATATLQHIGGKKQQGTGPETFRNADKCAN
jgi:hypothetical protein